MVTDVVPVLNSQITSAFNGNVLKDRRLGKISGRIRDGTATFKDAHAYAERLGEDLSKALVSTLTAENLPNGILYYNIAQRTVVPALENNYRLVNEAAKLIQKTQDKKSGIGLGAVSADFPAERINGLIDKMTSTEELDVALRWLGEPIVNNSEAFMDDYIDANVHFRHDVGLKATITRIADPKCCDWCAALEGTYEYGKAPDDIYRRHEFCRCTVTYQSEKTSQNVWSKRTWQSSPEEISRRQQVGQQSQISTAERLEQIRQLSRDDTVNDFMERTGYNRQTALRSTRGKDPAQVEAEIQKIIERQRTISQRG